MSSGDVHAQFWPTEVRLWRCGTVQTRVVGSIGDVERAIVAVGPDTIEVIDLVPVETPVDLVLAADWQWRARLRLALGTAGMNIENSYLTPRLESYTLSVECGREAGGRTSSAQ